MNTLDYEHPLEIDVASPHHKLIAADFAADQRKDQIMATIRLAPGATVLTGSHHGGVDRVSESASLLAQMLHTAIKALETWHEARIAAHNDAITAQLAAGDHRVLAELRATYCHNDLRSGK